MKPSIISHNHSLPTLLPSSSDLHLRTYCTFRAPCKLDSAPLDSIAPRKWATTSSNSSTAITLFKSEL